MIQKPHSTTCSLAKYDRYSNKSLLEKHLRNEHNIILFCLCVKLWVKNNENTAHETRISFVLCFQPLITNLDNCKPLFSQSLQFFQASAIK